jgi:hypothetical protein
MLLYPIKKYRYLRATHRAMAVYAKRLGYRYVITRGGSGHHRTDGYNVKEIVVGKDQSLEDRVITFAHELGHALDFAHEPMTVQEGHDVSNNVVSSERLMRESIAWDYGKTLLLDMKCYRYTEERFIEYRRTALAGYQAAMLKVKTEAIVFNA